MKKKKRIIIGAIILALAIVAESALRYSRYNQQNPGNKEILNISQNTSRNYVGSYYEENYIWAGAMNLAWNDLNENILHEKVELKTEDEIALDFVKKFNNPPFSKKDLDETSYYIKSGYGQETVNEINRESRKKFPSKSFADLDINLRPKDIISYAYFLKEVKYKTKFSKDDISFQEQKVEGFKTKNSEQKESIKILNYENDNNFIIKLELKDEKDELFLAKGYDMSDPQNIVNKINKYNKKTLPSLDPIDYFEAPVLHLDHTKNYNELSNKFLNNKGFEEYFIKEMYENIKFDMDEEGARVENEAVIMGFTNSINMQEIKKRPKYFILNKPYWIIMKRADSNNPYFILGVNNTEVMELVDIISL